MVLGPFRGLFALFGAVGRDQPLLSALRASYFLLLRQKKVSKEKATPAYAVGVADSPALLATGGRCGTRAFGPQTVLALFPPAAALLGATDGDPKGVAEIGNTRKNECVRRSLKNPNVRHHWLNPDVFPVPLRGAEQRRRDGGIRFALFEPQASSCEPPGSPSSARNPEGAPTQGSPSFWLLFLGEARKSTPALKAENSACQAKPTPA